MLKKNDLIQLKITSATAEGSGVGRTEDGLAVFVPMSAIGDELTVRILKVKKTYAFGKLEEIITPSPARIEPDCPNFSKCGGCVWRHITYAEECRIKERKVRDAVERIGGIQTEIKPIIACDRTDRYRNKAQLPVGKDRDGNVQIGFYSFHSHRIVDCGDCALQPEQFAEVIKITREFAQKYDVPIYDETTGKGRLRHLYIRYAEISDELMVCYVVNGNGLKHEDILLKNLREALPNLKTVIFNREKTNVILGSKNRVAYGEGTIEDELCGKRFRISTFSFWADGCASLIGVEIIPDAVRDAELNAERNGVKNARFICADAPAAAEQLRQEGVSPDVVILDPPRKGCGEELVETVAKMQPERVVYVSCDPATLARDLKYFAERGYVTREVTPCDMFSRTAHVESVALLTRNP